MAHPPTRPVQLTLPELCCAGCTQAVLCLSCAGQPPPLCGWQIKHAKLARELEASVIGERALAERVEELEQEAYHMLVEKHARQQGELRRLVEEAAEQVISQEEVHRLRGELGALMAKYDQACDEATQHKERCRQLELSRSKDDKGLDLALAQELVSSRISAESAQRRAEMTCLREVEERLAQSAAEAELLRSTRAAMERRLIGAKTKEEADEMVRRLDAAEAAAAGKHADYANLGYRAEEAERRLEQAVRDRQRHLAELTNLRTALRDAIARSESAAVVGKLHEALDHALAKEALARNALNRSELSRIELERELRKVKGELSTCHARAGSHQDQARWADKQRQEAQSQLDISLAARTESWKAKLWARKLQQLKVRNDAVAESLDLARRRIKKLEDMRNAAELKLEHVEDVGSLLQKGVSEVVRDAARLHEQLLQLRLERGKMQREEVLVREKLHYVERVNAELHELLEKYEAEFFQQQLALEADKATALAQARGLQDEMARLHERLVHALAGKDTESQDQTRKSQAFGLQVNNDVGARLKAHLSAAKAGDRDMMLKQIESLKAAREEAEHLRQECLRQQNELELQGRELSDVRRHHNDALARLQQQSEALLFALNHQQTRGTADESAVDQMKAVAEATVNELRRRLAEREKAVKGLQDTLDSEKSRWLLQHQADRQEIERLNQRLFQRNDASIGNLKELLSGIPKGDNSYPPSELAHLREAQRRAGDDLVALRSQLEQKDAALEVVKHSLEAQVRKLESELEAAQQELNRMDKQVGDARAMRSTLDKLQGQLRTKDDKLRQLRDAFKLLETKLIEAHKRIADEDIRRADMRKGELKERDKMVEERVQELTSKLQAELQAAHAAAARAEAGQRSGAASAHEALIVSLKEQLAFSQERGRLLEHELAATRAELQKFKNAERTVVDLTTGMSVEAKRQIEELQKRVNVLERQNQQLKRSLVNEEARGSQTVKPTRGPAPAGSAAGGDSHDEHAGTHPGSTRPAGSKSESSRPRPPVATPQGGAHPARVGATAVNEAGSAGAGEDAGLAANRTAVAVAQWEESKKLSKKVDELRKKLADKQEEVTTAKAESDKRGAQLAQLQLELDKQGHAMRDMQEKLRKAQEAPRMTADTAKLREYAERLLQAEAEADKLRVALARAESRPAPTAPQPASKAGSAPEAASLAHDADLFELRIQRDQAQLQVKRLQERLQELFGAEALDLSSARVAPAARARPSSGGRGAGASTAVSTREAELLSTVNTMKIALEKATASSTPTIKFMAEVAKRKDAQRELESSRQEADKLRAQASTLQRMLAELQSGNAELRKQLRAAQEVATASGSASATAATSMAQVVSLEQLLSQRDAELRAVKAMLADREEQLKAGVVPNSVREELSALQSQLAVVEAENQDLKAELNAFDPAFFEEIEDLKHEHFVLGNKVKEYEQTISRLHAQLGMRQ
ncbi:hypothetical protein V8C86DRAFT_2603588 [Haematococcus lacustris]